ncbi:MAG: M48 family metalloprotease [Opitutae bacterium]|nr:M48 family metalloprotease [Opitutae bacterium]
MHHFQNINEKIRFDADSPEIYGFEKQHRQPRENARGLYSSSGVRITGRLFPDVQAALNKAESKLNLPNPIEGYVLPDTAAQAGCITISEDFEFLVTLSSGLIELLTAEELCFVVGHEVGHFLFQHSSYPLQDEAQNEHEHLNRLQLSRASEISVDRTGFLCVDSLEIAGKAILKSASGLSDRHIRFDINDYLSQLRDPKSAAGSSHEIYSTHPKFALRLKALVLFSMSQPYYDWIKRKEQAPLTREKLDQRIKKELSESSGNALETLRDSTLVNALIWAIASLVVADKLLTKDEQSMLNRHIGEKNADKLINFIKSSGEELMSEIEKRLQDALESAKGLPMNLQKKLLEKIKDAAEECSGEAEMIRQQVQYLKSCLL